MFHDQSRNWNVPAYRLVISLLNESCYAKSLARLGANVVGIDASNENVHVAQRHAKKDPRLISGPGRVEYRCITAGE